jgi:organic hydroperoxide reductase OsmC/OhrA
MTKNERGVPWVNHVTLHPKIQFAGERSPTAEELEHLHHQAHEQCFIAASVKTEVTVAK